MPLVANPSFDSDLFVGCSYSQVFVCSYSQVFLLVEMVGPNVPQPITVSLGYVANFSN